MRVYLGSDHAGFELKARLVEHVNALGHEAVGLRSAHLRSRGRLSAALRHRGDPAVDDPGILAIVIGGSGNGEQIAANKVTGVRAALVWSDDTARLAREHNDANVISIGARNHPDADAFRFVEIFLATPFSQGDRHKRRIAMLAEYEATGAIAGHETA